ncbi:MAG: hypothetical protein M5U28_23805 [Sandaracinaceae bacterium]|nr:hypothetical protein [Sandaracinaceae bacterium]
MSAQARAVKSRNGPSAVRSATAPLTMVAAVAAKTSWKKRKTKSGKPSGAPATVAPASGAKPPRPIQALPPPNIRPKPTA